MTVQLATCPRCGRATSDQDVYCASCGGQVTPVGTMVGIKLTDGDDLLLEKLREVTVGEYEIRGLLGRGGMASVFVAYDLTLNRKVALKVMHPGLLGDSGMRERFRLEARLAARLDHPNIVTVHAVKERANFVFFDLKLIDGTSLDRLIRHRDTPVPSNVARWITAKIADALHYAHSEGVVHRDMKPANVMVEKRGDCIVTDFGIAKAAESPHLTMTGSVVGTPAYMSPEQCLGNEVGAFSDQYSLGILAYELFVGQVPFSGSMLTIQLGHVEKVPPAPHTLVPEIPQAASDAVMRMIAKEPEDRWPTLADASDALLHGLGASDLQMRKQLAGLVAALPPDTGRPSLPATPRSPTPQTINHDDPTQPTVVPMAAAPSTAGSAIAWPVTGAPARKPEVATELMPLTPMRATPVLTHEAIDAAHEAAKPARTGNRRMLMLAAAGVVSVGIVAFMTLSGGKAAKPAEAVVVAPVDSTAIKAARDSALALDANADTVIARIGVNPISPVMRVGDSLLVKVTAYGLAGDVLPVAKLQWSSSDSALVIVNAAGWIHAIAKTGSSPVFVTATGGKRSGVASVTVR